MLTNSLDLKKQKPTLDEIVDNRMGAIIDIVNDHIGEIYNDFNKAMSTQNQKLIKTEHDLSEMTKILWGIINQANARSAALESVLIKNGLSPEELSTELGSIIKEMKKNGAWVEVPLSDVLEKGEIPLPHPKDSI